MTPEQQAELHKWREGVDSFIAESSLYRRATSIRMDAMEKNLEANTEMTAEMHSGLQGAIPVILDLAGAARTAKRIGSAIKPVFYVVSVVTAVAVWWKTGRWEMP